MYKVFVGSGFLQKYIKYTAAYIFVAFIFVDKTMDLHVHAFKFLDPWKCEKKAFNKIGWWKKYKDIIMWYNIM